MKTYTVTAHIPVTVTVEVEASNPYKAQDIAAERFADHDMQLAFGVGFDPDEVVSVVENSLPQASFGNVEQA